MPEQSEPYSWLLLIESEQPQEIAAAPATLDAFSTALREQVASGKIRHTSDPTTALFGMPLVADPAMPLGYIVMRQTPKPKPIRPTCDIGRGQPRMCHAYPECTCGS